MKAKDTTMLLTVLATIPFLAALAVAVLALQATVGSSWDRIAAALRGESQMPVVATRPVKVRFNPRSVRSRPLRAEPQWRAAA